MENCVLEQHFTVAVLRNEIRRIMTATISLFICVSQQDVTHKEMVWFNYDRYHVSLYLCITAGCLTQRNGMV